MRKDGLETKKKILSACVHLFLEQGYKNTSISQITKEAGVTRGSFQNLFPTKDAILLELAGTMFDGQFGMAKDIAKGNLSPLYVYAAETAIQLTITEMNENLRDIYLEAYTIPSTADFLHLHTAKELKAIFGPNFPDYSDSDFYEMEIGSAGIMRNYMAKECDVYFPLERKIERFLEASMRVYKVPEGQQKQVFDFIAGLDVEALATDVMNKLFTMLETSYDFKLDK
jgi:AcrR family transcriptional regulator